LPSGLQEKPPTLKFPSVNGFATGNEMQSELLFALLYLLMNSRELPRKKNRIVIEIQYP
jgi:hypothetical protein